MKSLRLLLPAMLAGVGVFLLVGCIYIPTFNGVKEGRNYSKLVGDAKSRKPVRVGRSTIEDALRILGVPYLKKGNGEALAYAWTVRTGVAVWPLCFHAESMEGYRTLVLRFDAEGRLASYEILKTNEPFLDLAGVRQPMPQDFKDASQQQQQQFQSPATRPTVPHAR